MSQDQDTKTEEATEKRLADASDEGNVASSLEVPALFVISALLIMVVYIVPLMTKNLLVLLTGLLEHNADIRLHDRADLDQLGASVLTTTAGILLPALGLLTGLALIGNFLKQPFRLVLKRAAPDLSRISPVKGLKRLFGLDTLVETAKSTLKLMLILGMGWLVLWNRRQEIAALMLLDPLDMTDRVRQVASEAVAVVCAVTVAIAAADYCLARFRWIRSLRMTKEEVKQERKESEGDPLIKARIKSLARSRSRARMIQDIPRATFVVANPTHYAVALRYVRDEMSAPMVLAKGRDLIALRIRGIAEDCGIEVIENKPLARALHDVVQVGRPVPSSFYRPLAEIINYLNTRRRPGAVLSQSSKRP
jgi:flagellar biosynthesis protein FlhB